MSDKPFKELSALDQRLRRELPVGMLNGIQLRIEKVVGFELFNTRPYHNHETWSDGYSVVGPISGDWSPYARLKEALAALVSDVAADARSGATDDEIAARFDDRGLRPVFNAASGSMSRLLRVEREDLDDAIEEWFERCEKVREILAEDPPGENQRTRLAVLGYHYSQDGSEATRDSSLSPSPSSS